MIADEDRVPRNVIEECARRGDGMVERLNEVLGKEQNPDEETLGEWWLSLHAIMTLGLIPAEAAGLLLVRTCAHSPRSAATILARAAAGRNIRNVVYRRNSRLGF